MNYGSPDMKLSLVQVDPRLLGKKYVVHVVPDLGSDFAHSIIRTFQKYNLNMATTRLYIAPFETRLPPIESHGSQLAIDAGLVPNGALLIDFEIRAVGSKSDPKPIKNVEKTTKFDGWESNSDQNARISKWCH